MGQFLPGTDQRRAEPPRGWIRSRDAMKRFVLGFAGLVLGLVAMKLLGGTSSFGPRSTEPDAVVVAADVEPPSLFDEVAPPLEREVVVPEFIFSVDAARGPSHFAFLDGGYYRDPEICDPVEPGECTLELTAIHASEGPAFGCEVALFRLGAPKNERWSEGDQCLFDRLEVASGKVRSEGTRISNLPAGRYRVAVLQSAPGTPDPPPFEVKGPVTRHTFEFSRPPSAVAYIELFDESGARVQSAQMEFGAYRVKARETRQPSWRRARKWIGPYPLKALPRYLSARTEGGRAAEPDQLAGSAGFVTGSLRLDTFGSSFETPIRFTDSRGSTCTVVVKGSHVEGSRRYVGVLASAQSIANAVVTADGQVPESLASSIVVEAQGAHLQYGSADQAWLDVPIEVSIAHREFHEIRSSFTMRRGIPAIPLTRRP